MPCGEIRMDNLYVEKRRFLACLCGDRYVCVDANCHPYTGFTDLGVAKEHQYCTGHAVLRTKDGALI